ncbi:type II toxin-antitoxin system VapC family toxin [Pseudactinotalea sp. HY158]|uniref:type II toxin-antitoxin system VapC family toxin n=1 Tax=Pseudactinotalea sp. HY158 TaxID=2654547 RepID=UPI00129CA222|nr:type II toxin-antitoxin system VapC family toxin [Pseudactinotalea sp. HY158]QGH70014.1 PIN domain-containing protein [Pseudactinotalea sp. HY158]
MKAQVVCDASAVVALLLDSGADGRWSTDALIGADLHAPTLLPFEVANILRRHELAGLVTSDQASAAHADLLGLAIEQWPYELLGPRAWQLRPNLTAYDAGYVALAELLDATLVTLDRRIGRAPGLRCAVAAPEQ